MRRMVLAAGAVVAAAGASAGVRVVAVEGQAAPGFESPFLSIGVGSINDAGQVLFFGRARGGDDPSYGSVGLWLDDGGQTRLVARVGSLSSDGERVTALHRAALTQSGAVFIGGEADRSSSDYESNFGRVWRWTGDALERVGADSAGAFQFVESGPYPDGAGNIVVQSWSINGAPSTIWKLSAGASRVVAAAGRPAPSGVGTLEYVGNVHALGESAVLYSGLLEHGSMGVDWRNDSALFVDVDGEARVALREGDPAPGVPGARFANVGVVDSNPTGEVLLYGQLRIEPPVSEGNDVGLWAGPLDDLKLVVREGDPIPGAGARVDSEYGLNSWFKLGVGGDVVFGGTLDRSDPGVDHESDHFQAAWNGETVSLLYREGDPWGSGAFIWDYETGGAVNAAGVAAFYASWHGVDDRGREIVSGGVWLSGGEGGRRMLLRPGQRLDLGGLVENGDEAVVTDISNYAFIQGPSHGVESTFWNDRDEMAILCAVQVRRRRLSVLIVIDTRRPAACPEDVTGDGLVNSDDLAIVLASWGSLAVGDDEAPDVSGDLVVSAADLTRLLAAWGTCAKSGFTSVSSIP